MILYYRQTFKSSLFKQGLGMKKVLAISFYLLLGSSALFATTSWEAPPVLCPEEILAKGIPCLDLSQVTNPYTDFPSDISNEEMLDWNNNKAADLKLCRRKEILEREKNKPGSFSAANLAEAWMVVDSATDIDIKLNAVQSASIKYEIPPQILIGALKQESLLASIGISPDGGNFSCGMSQINIQEWCQSMNQLSQEERIKYEWPTIKCDGDTLPTNIVKPFYDIAIKNIGTRHLYQLSSDDFKGITPEQVENNFPPANNDTQSRRFKAIMSFVNKCQDARLSILFKAQNLRSLYDQFVPTKLKNSELYTAGKSFPKACQQPYSTKAYPLHTGWLFAVAMYNAGPIQTKLVKHYYQVKDNNYPKMNPLSLIEALHWGGKYKPGTDRVFFKDQSGKEYSQRWYKSCIVQRHVARVIQHVTVPGVTIANSLEQVPCAPNIVPEYRKSSSGVKAK